MECPWNRFCEKNKMYAPLILRVVFGITMAVHGYQKLTGGVGNVAGFFGNLGIPAPLLMAWVVTLVELIGGIALVLGLAVRHFSALLVVVMAVAIAKVHFVKGLTGQGGYELALLYLAANLSLCFSGAGPFSLDNLLCGKKKAEMEETVSTTDSDVPKSKHVKSKK